VNEPDAGGALGLPYIYTNVKIYIYRYRYIYKCTYTHIYIYLYIYRLTYERSKGVSEAAEAGSGKRA